MAKKTKDTGTSTTPKKASAPADPVKTRNLVRLLNILALLLAITAFLLQLFAVLSHHWKWQSTNLHPLDPRTAHNAQHNIYGDSRLDQNYGLYSREVKVYADNDKHMDLWASTRFPRVDENDEVFHQCLSRTSTVRGAFLTCSEGISSPEQCHCRRYHYWSWVIFFEIFALILLGLVIVLVSLLSTEFGPMLKLAGAGLSVLAFLLLFIGLILILAHLKRETRTVADVYPHLYQRLSNQLTVLHEGQRAGPYHSVLVRSLVRRQREQYRAYSLSPGQRPFNETHFQEYSERLRSWVQIPYTSLHNQVPYQPSDQQSPYQPSGQQPLYQPVPLQQRPRTNPPTTRRSSTTTTTAPTFNAYGPIITYDKIFEHTNAGIGCSTVLSILAMILALLLPGLLAFSWMTGKKLAPETKTVTTTTVKTEYVPVSQDIPVETITSRPIPTTYDYTRPIGEAVVATHNVGQKPYDVHATRAEGDEVRDVIISGIRSTPAPRVPGQEHTFQAQIDTSQLPQRT